MNLDPVEQLVFESEICVGVLGKAGGDFILVPLMKDGPIDGAVTDAAERGYSYCGVLGIVNGVPGAKCEPDADADSILCCLLGSLAFARMVCDRIKPAPKGDAVEWLTKLHGLADTRPGA